MKCMYNKNTHSSKIRITEYMIAFHKNIFHTCAFVYGLCDLYYNHKI